MQHRALPSLNTHSTQHRSLISSQWSLQAQPSQTTPQFEPSLALTGSEPLWGYLLPLVPGVPQVEFPMSKLSYILGRSKDEGINDIALPGCRLSYTHCKIEWNGRIGSGSVVTASDQGSMNGFRIGQVKYGGPKNRRKFAILHDGDEMTLQVGSTHGEQEELEYRYVYNHLANQPSPGSIDDHYNISEVLGSGAYGTVMKAMCNATGKWFAIKQINYEKFAAPNSKLTDADKLEIRNEVQGEILAQMKVGEHENICKFFKAYTDNNSVYLVLEYVAGGDLHKFLRKQPNGRLDEDLGRFIICQIFNGIVWIHHHGVAHRDMKVENVLFTDEDPPTIKIADFGLAKVVNETRRMHTMCGTPVYIAPEVGQDNGYDMKVDSWSIGIIAFMALTGKPPTKRILRSMISVAEPLRSLGISECGIKFIVNLLKIDPSKRMSAEEALAHPWLTDITPSSIPKKKASVHRSAELIQKKRKMLHHQDDHQSEEDTIPLRRDVLKKMSEENRRTMVLQKKAIAREKSRPKRSNCFRAPTCITSDEETDDE